MMYINEFSKKFMEYSNKENSIFMRPLFKNPEVLTKKKALLPDER